MNDFTTTKDYLAPYYDWPELKTCIQCGTCSGSCPMSQVMEISPRKLVGLVSRGRGAAALSSNSIWMCASCYNCTLHCPRGIPLTEAIYALKREFRERHPERLSPFYETFTRMIRERGRVNEVGLMMKLAQTTPVGTLLSMAGTGTAMMLRKRLPLTGHSIKGATELQTLWRFAQERG